MRVTISFITVLLLSTMLPAQQIVLQESWDDGNWNQNPEWMEFQGENEPDNCFAIVENRGHDDEPCAEVRHGSNIGYTALYTSMNCGDEFYVDLWIHKRTPTFSIFRVGVCQGEYTRDNLGVEIRINHHNENGNWYLCYWDHGGNAESHNQIGIEYPDDWVNLVFSRDPEGVWTVIWNPEGDDNDVITEFQDNFEELDDPHIWWSGGGYYHIEGGAYIDDIIVFVAGEGVPIIIVDPGFIEAEESSEYVLNIANDGDGQLWWRAEAGCEWINLDPRRGIVGPAEDVDLFVILDAEDLDNGVYEDDLRILSNDPENPVITVDVTLFVGGGDRPEWTETPESITVRETELILFDIRGVDSEGDDLTITFNEDDFPDAVEFTDYGDGSGTFYWETSLEDDGEYQAIFTLSDGVFRVYAELPVIVSEVLSNFDLILPLDGAWTDRYPDVEFIWHSGSNLAQDSLHYKLSIAHNQGGFWIQDIQDTILNVPRDRISFDPDEWTELVWMVWAFAGSDSLRCSTPFHLTVAPLSVKSAGDGLPTKMQLEPAFPNPFNSSTMISFSLPSPGLTSLAIYNLQGRQVTELVNGWYNSGKYSILWDASEMPDGVYYARLSNRGETRIAKLLMVK